MSIKEAHNSEWPIQMGYPLVLQKDENTGYDTKERRKKQYPPNITFAPPKIPYLEAWKWEWECVTGKARLEVREGIRVMDLRNYIIIILIQFIR